MTLTADNLVLFGATGDLAQRMLLPSLFALHADRLVSPQLAILGTGEAALEEASAADEPWGSTGLLLCRSSPRLPA